MKSILKVCSISVLCFGLLTTVKGQTNAIDTDFVKNYKLNFTVPDLPAFKALGTDPSNIMKPTEMKDFSAAIAPFYSGGKAVIPQNFALEVSPGKLASKHWRLDEYKGIKRILYNTGFSLGTIRDSTNNASKIALGARVSLLPKKNDLNKRAKATYPDQKKFSELRAVLRVDFNGYVSSVHTFDAFLDTLNKNPKAYGTKVEADWDSLVTYVGKIPKRTVSDTMLTNTFFNNRLDSILNRFTKWNETRYDFAVAFVGQSPDSLASTSQFSSFQLWATGAWGFGKNTQLLLGANVILPRAENADTFHVNLSLNARCYVGVNNFKGFVETQFKYQTYSSYNKSLLINFGAEFKLSNAFWVVATGGLNNYLDTPSPVNALVSSISLKYGFATNSKKQ